MMKKIIGLILFVLLATPAFASFPTTGILDNFNRSNEGPPMTGWTDTVNGLSVASNKATWTTDSSFSYLNGATYGADVEAYITFSTLPGSTDNSWLAVRYDTASNNYYKINYLKNASAPDTITLAKVTAGVSTTLATYSATTISGGDSIGISAVGSTITAYYKASAGSWTTLGSVTDSTYSGSGRIGLRLASHSGYTVDDLGGGTVIVSGSTTFQDGTSGYDGERDTVLYDFTTNEHIEAALNYDIRSNRVGLFYFDISTIPTGATVTSATLTLYREETNNAGGNLGLYYVTDPASTGGGSVYTWCGAICDVYNTHATYAEKKHEATQIGWDNSASDVTVNKTLIANTSNFTQFSIGTIAVDVTAAVQRWVNNSASNLGFVTVVGNAGDPVIAITTYLGSTTANRPKLDVSYSTGGGTGRKKVIVVE